MAKPRLLFVIAALIAFGCDGTIGDNLGGSPAGTGNSATGTATGTGSGMVNGTSGSGSGVGAGGGGGGTTPGTDRLTDPAGLGYLGLSRLSKREYQQSLADLLGVPAPAALSSLPEDILTPYDNDYASQATSAVLIAGVADVAREAVTGALSTAAKRAMLVPCTPARPDDAVCFKTFIESFGRRALHRPLSAEEVTEYAALQMYSTSHNDFYAGVAMVMRAMLQDIEFIYRVEAGTPVSQGLVRLTPYELANRMSFTLLGTLPGSSLLDAAAAGRLDAEPGVRETAQQLLANSRAIERVGRFHAQWLSYEQLQVEPLLGASMRAESDALIAKVLFQDRRPWKDLFTSDQAFVDNRLAPIYGLPSPATPGWVTQVDSNRRGLLGQASFLAGGAKFGDTSPVLRGLQIRMRLMCQVIPPPPIDVNADVPPAGSPSDCKATRYANHRANPCASCHALLDPAGNGLERYDAEGRFRMSENGRPDCPIDGQGQLNGLNVTFSGPLGLANALLPTGLMEQCVMQQLFQYVVGRQLNDADRPSVASLAQTFAKDENHFPDTLLDLVSSVAFRHRVTEARP